MKGFKCRNHLHFYLSAVIFSLFLALSHISSTALALELGSVNNHTITSGVASVYYNPTNGTYTYNGYQAGGGSFLFNLTGQNRPSSGNLNRIQLNFGVGISANSLFSFSVRWINQGGADNLAYNGLSGGINWTLISSNCVENAQNSQGAYDMTCTYLGYTSQDISILYISGTNSRILYIPSSQNDTTLVFTNFNSIKLSSGTGASGGLSQTDINFLSENFGAILNNQATEQSILNQIKTLLQAFPTAEAQAQATAEAIQGVLEEQKEQERSDFNDTQNDAESAADESAADSQAEGVRLYTAFSGFVSAVSSAQPTDCRINFDLSNYTGGSNTVIDLCSLPKPSFYNIIASVVVVGFVVSLSWATANKFIDLIATFQGWNREPYNV